MAATYKGILTNNGKALIANATVNNKINYSHIAVGDGNGSVPTPLETRTALVNEKARIALNVVEINPNNTNQITCEAIIPTTTGGFYIRELGLYAGTTMVVNANYPPTYKPMADEGSAREIAIKIVINIQNAEVIALYLDDSLIYATREWVNTNYIPRDELIDNLTTNDATKPLSAKQGKNLQDNKLDKTENSVSASKWQTARTISYSGAATGSVTFDGSANASCVLTLANSGVTASTYGSNIIIPIITFNAKGLATGVSTQTIRSASTSQTGVVQLVDDLATDDAAKALTAKQGKKLQDEKAALSGATFTGEVVSTSDNSFRLKNSKRSVFWRQDINNFYLMKTADDDPSGTWDNTRPIMWELKNNKLFIGSDVEFQASAKGNLTGNADTASKLQTPRAINGVNFDGSQDVIVNIPYRGGISSNANANAALTPGQYSVSEWNDNPAGLYGYGVFMVYRAPNGAPIHQIYYAHMDNGKGSVQVRQTWDANGTAFTDWRVLDNQFVATGPKAILNNSQMPAWNDVSGVYRINDSNASRTAVHFKSDGSASAFQLLIDHSNRGLWYRSSRDNAGFENDFQKILTNTGNQSINGNLTLTDTINISFPDSIGAF